MKLLRYLIEIPIIILFIWGIYNAEFPDTDNIVVFYLWPSDTDLKINLKLLLFIFFCSGYILGKLDTWFKYAPLRKELRRQKKTNKALNKEQEKLNQTVSGLKQDVVDWQEKVRLAKTEENSAKSSDITKNNHWWNNIKTKFSHTKGM